MSSSDDLTLRPLVRADFSLLAAWLDQPHVARWWHHDTSPRAIERDFGASIDGSDPAEVFIASIEGRHFGLLQRYTFGDHPAYIDELAALLPVPGAALSMDYFVGEPAMLRCGLGAAMLQAALRSSWQSHASAPAVVIPVVAANTASWRLLERVGFQRVAQGPLQPDNPIDDDAHYIYRIERPADVPASNAGYGAHAAEVARRYESIRFEELHRGVLHLFPTRPCDVLDIGAGSGRDAAALAKQGHRVVAAEPTLELRSEGMRLHAALPIEWVDDHLPALEGLRASHRRFDLILLTAVWMHLEESERTDAMATISELLAERGLISMSLRHGPVPQDRRMFEVSAAETIELARQHGLRCKLQVAQADSQGRSDVRWTFLVFERV
jgi:RimJ/RimL family protein N-acetyltransferase